MNLKYNCQRDIFVVLFLLSCVKTAGSVKNINKFTFKVKQDFTETIVHQFRKYDLSLLFKIPPTTYIFEHTGDGDGSSVFQTVLHHFRDEIVEAEPVRVYNNTLKPEESKSWDRENSSYGET
ncbi:uncharacterized protein LOC128554176, partial [Mercenaria mercenaria]|uniref:uncharacterized protein LOC128554176 n=1 Tax=Mercenaria mercenaria TaxID=6596 RepID=UPI00234F5C92